MNIEDNDEHVLYVGRFNPPHLGHMNIFEESLKLNRKICIAIRNMAISEKNPLPASTIENLWKKIYSDNPLVMVIVIPNISSIKYGRNVGYDLEEIKVEQTIANISATEIRNSIAEGDDSWKKNVSPIIHKDLEELFKTENIEA